MCGIFGIYFLDSSRIVSRQMVLGATNTMLHRGPDDSGLYVNGNIGFGHRRLSIIDLSSGHQPMLNKDETIVVVYNGEIYNHADLRESLIKNGHTFKTRCDTEVIIHAYEEWGTACLENFNGMFAFALWDSKDRILWLVRDRLGIKPLYYVWSSDFLIFSSEIKAILKTGLVKSELNEKVLDAYFTLGYVPGPETMFKGICKLEPGSFIKVKGREFSKKVYWDFAEVEPAESNFEKSLRDLKELLCASIERRLMSDVPLGVFLSGGLDSSAVLSIATQLANGPIKTFSVGYKGAEEANELQFANDIAQKFHSDHHTFILEPHRFMDSIEILLFHMEEPVVEPAAIALYHIARLAKSKATVLLSGEGADESLAGYELYYVMLRIENMKRLIPGIGQVLSPLNPARFLAKEKYRKYADWMFLPIERSYRGTSADLTPSIKPVVYTADFHKCKGNYLEKIFTQYFDRAKSLNTLSKILYVDTKTWLVDDLLLKADKMTMAASVELRVPFLDHKLIENVAAMPSEFKIKNGAGKYILKRAMENHLPQHIIYRKKMGFPVPIGQWFAGQLHEIAREILMDSFTKRGYIRRQYVEKLFQEHGDGHANHSRRIFSLLNLEMWLKKYIEA